jgi:hypothetical protein
MDSGKPQRAYLSGSPVPNSNKDFLFFPSEKFIPEHEEKCHTPNKNKKSRIMPKSKRINGIIGPY